MTVFPASWQSSTKKQSMPKPVEMLPGLFGSLL
jgi:hypothetical protein